MKTRFIFCWFGAGLMLLVAGCNSDGDSPLREDPAVKALQEKPRTADAQSVEALAQGNTDFALHLFEQLREQDGNLFFSPYSISSAMGMVYAGARGETASEIQAALHFNPGPKLTPEAFYTLNNELHAQAKASGQQLDIANGLCLVGGDVSADYQRLLELQYSASIFHGDLARINAWVSDKTQGKIEKILEQLAADTVCVILNAIYFKGEWAEAFDKKDTHEADFHVTSDQSIQVPMMYIRETFRLLENELYRAIELPYEGERFSMIVMLPRKTGDLATVEAALIMNQWPTLVEQLKKQPKRKVELFLPKFKLETEYDLVSSLKALGIQDAFMQGTADFSGMGWPKGELWIDQVVHKAFVEVNEEGTEAAAATAVAMMTTSLPNYPVFRADQPFLFFILDQSTNSILFMGRMTNPQASEGN